MGRVTQNIYDAERLLAKDFCMGICDQITNVLLHECFTYWNPAA